MIVNDIAFARSGDKGNISDITVFARDKGAYAHLVGELTAERVSGQFGGMVRGPVARWELPNVWALKFVLTDALAGGGPASLRADNLGKALAGAVLRVQISDMPRPNANQNLHPPHDPYGDSDWVVRSVAMSDHARLPGTNGPPAV